MAYCSRDPCLRSRDVGLQLGWASAPCWPRFRVGHVAGAAWGGLGLKLAWVG